MATTKIALKKAISKAVRKAKPRKPKAGGAPAPAAPDAAPVFVAEPHPVRLPPTPVPSKPKKGLSPDEEIAQLEKDIASIQARLEQLRHPFQEFPKEVNGRTFNTREEQDKAGADFKDKK